VVVIFFIGAFFSSAVSAQEVLYPAGYDIDFEYIYEPSDFYQTGSVKIYWTVENNEDFDLSGLYYTENLPTGLSVDDYSVFIDGAPIEAYYTGPQEGHLREGYDTYRWVIDFPNNSGQIDNILEPGKALRLQYEITADNPEDYVLPFHTVCFYGDDTGFFTLADTVFLPPPAQEIPTLSEWGILIMALLLLAGATISAIGKNKIAVEETP
jgi:hypothetical protein